MIHSASGYGNSACYSRNKCLLNFPDGGASVSRHHWRKHPAVLGHFLKDVSPFDVCCRLAPTGGGVCNSYWKHRPTLNCTDYMPPRVGEYFL